MAKIKLTKSELKKQRDDLRRFERFLPMLQLKKQQLQIQLLRTDSELQQVEAERESNLSELSEWVAVLGSGDTLREHLKIRQLRVGNENIAGVDLPVFGGVEFEPVRYDLMDTPLWFDRAIPAIRQVLEMDARLLVLSRRRTRIARELLTTSQRVNLFERVRIPDARDNIRRLKIFLGDQQAASVVRGKIAKRKRQEAQPVS